MLFLGSGCTQANSSGALQSGMASLIHDSLVNAIINGVRKLRHHPSLTLRPMLFFYRLLIMCLSHVHRVGFSLLLCTQGSVQQLKRTKFFWLDHTYYILDTCSEIFQVCQWVISFGIPSTCLTHILVPALH